jgi:c-di-GMP-binding flagellar brake protein YcgR
MDRRTRTRMDVQLTCYVAAGKVLAAPMRGFTENVSRTGMLMRWADGHPVPKVGSKLNLEVPLPENSEFGPRVMSCRTTVVRVLSAVPAGHEIGLKIHSMRFNKSKSATRRILDLASMPLPTERVS